MVEQCGGEVVQQDMEEHEGIQTSLLSENVQDDVGEKTAWLSMCGGRASVDQDVNIPSTFEVADAGGECASTQCDELMIGSPESGFVGQVNCEASSECCDQELVLGVSELSFKFEEEGQKCCNSGDAPLENFPLKLIEHQSETGNCSKISENGPSEILEGIGSLSFYVQEDDTKSPDGNLEYNACSLSLNAQHDGTSQPGIDKACGPSLNKEALTEDNQPSCLDTSHLFEDLNFTETCTEKQRPRQMCDNQSSFYGSSQNLLMGLPNTSLNCSVKKTETVSSPLTAVEMSPSVDSPSNIKVLLNADQVNDCAIPIREQLLHAERIHMTGMGNISAQMARHRVKKNKAAKRGRRSSKAVKFDECMKSFSMVARKKRSYFSKPAVSYIWWSSGAVLQSPKIGKADSASENVSQGERGFSRSKDVGKKLEPGGMVFGGKNDTCSTRAPVKSKLTRGTEKASRRALVPDIHGGSPPQTTDHAFELVKECSGQLKGECNMKYNRSNRGIQHLQSEYAFVNSKQAEPEHDIVKLGDTHAFQIHNGITHDTTLGAENVYLATSLQDGNTFEEENVENSFLNPETSPDSEVIDTIPEICLAGRDEDDMAKDVPLTSFGCLGIQGGATSINFTYSSRKKGKKKELPVLCGAFSPTSQSTNSTSYVPGHKFDGTTNASISIELSESVSGIIDSGVKGINSLDSMASEIKETCPDQILKLGNHFTSGSGCASKEKSDSVVPDAWASCDICDKWRRIPSALADYIARTDCRWTCYENSDKAFADCSIPQEKSDHAINVELELSDCDEDGDEGSEATELKKRQTNAFERERWTPIKTNSYLHRKRKNQTIDEIMVCHCKPPRDGGLGCGEECLNRMLNIECDRRTCPCGDLCSNQQFQERKYSKLKSFKCGKKGYGLRSEEAISRGQFLIEYVGEVLDMPAYEARQKDYALKGHKHFYFMTLNGSEVIDACSKGNLGRYINHSCDPNCRTEKWMVNGEICVGLFAMKNIKKGEEITFDYNYVRVFGAAAKKCKCGSSQCRGFIGGDPLNCEVVAYDSDEGISEELEADRESISSEEIISTTKITSFDENQDAVISTMIETYADASTSTSSFLQSENPEELIETMHLKQHLRVPHAEYSFPRTKIDVEEKIARIAHKPFMAESSSLIGLGNEHNLKTVPDIVEVDRKPSRSVALKKSKISQGSLKKANVKAPKIRLKKSELITSTSKKALIVSSRHEVDAVQEKLNELLDSGGGISKRRESSKGYLKLLILTTASDNSGNGEAIQSNRDISMILDALLKTKSRAVLADIINKNGLRMLHNIMKQYRRDFNRTPILRKLLKILEHLAENQILNSDHINGGPPCLGMESFAESVLSLTEHRNRQVYQIARSFRDKWIHRPIRKFSCNDEGKSDFQRGSRDSVFSASRNNHTDSPKDSKGQVHKVVISSTQVDGRRHEGCLGFSGNSFATSGSTGRKRKSRWDQDEWVRRDGTCVRHNDLKAQYPNPSQLVRLKEASEVAVNTTNVRNGMFKSEVINMDEDLPPGFAAPCQDRGKSCASSLKDDLGSQKFNCTPNPSEVVQGHPLRKFISRSPVSYGIPVSIVNQDVTSQSGTADDWEISPSLPFHPFPPLPMYPRTMISPPDFSSISVHMEAPESCISSSSSNHSTQRSSSASAAYVGGHTNSQYSHKRPRGEPEVSGNMFFRQKKLMIPPWIRRRHGGFVQNNPRT